MNELRTQPSYREQSLLLRRGALAPLSRSPRALSTDGPVASPKFSAHTPARSKPAAAWIVPAAAKRASTRTHSPCRVPSELFSANEEVDGLDSGSISQPLLPRRARRRVPLRVPATTFECLSPCFTHLQSSKRACLLTLSQEPVEGGRGVTDSRVGSALGHRQSRTGRGKASILLRAGRYRARTSVPEKTRRTSDTVDRRCRETGNARLTGRQRRDGSDTNSRNATNDSSKPPGPRPLPLSADFGQSTQPSSLNDRHQHQQPSLVLMASQKESDVQGKAPGWDTHHHGKSCQERSRFEGTASVSE